MEANNTEQNMYGRQSGLDDGEQILYGLSTAGIEIATEKLFGGLKIAYGKGVADKAAGKAITKMTERLAETSAGKAVSKFASSGTGKVIAAAFGEGMEEVISDLLQPGVDVAFGLSEEYEVHLEDIVYDGLLGGFVGLLGGGTNLAQNRLAQRAAETQTTYNTLAQGGVTAEQQWATMRSQDPSLSGALFSANNRAALMAEFEQVKQGAKSGIAFAFNSIQQTGAVNTNEAAVTAAVRSATEGGAVTEQDESTVVNTDPNEHTAAEQRVIDEYQAAVDEGLTNFVNSVMSKQITKQNARYELKPVSDRAAKDIKRITGVDVSGNKTVIEARQVEHIIKRHGENGTADKSMRDINDVGRIQYVLDNYDSVLESGRSEAYSTNKANGKRGTAKTVVFEKAVNGTYYVVEAVPDTAANTTYIVSAYMSKKGAKKAAPSSVTGKESPRATPKHARRVAADDNVSQIDADVNFADLRKITDAL